MIPAVSLAVTAGMERLDATAETLIPMTAHTLRADGFDASEDGTGRGTPIVPIAFAQNQRDEVRDLGGIAGACAAEPGMKQQTFIAMPDVAGTMKANNGGGGWSNSVDHAAAGYMVPTSMAVRRLTPKECERLQGWPDDHTRFGRKESGKDYEQADGPRYKQCGNGVTANVAEWIGRNLIQAAEATR